MTLIRPFARGALGRGAFEARCFLVVSCDFVPSGESQDVRCSTTPLGKGAAARPRCIPQPVARTRD